MSIPKTLVASALAAGFIATAPASASAATQTWARTFGHAGATAVVPFKPSSVRCYTLPGRQLRRAGLYPMGVGKGPLARARSFIYYSGNLNVSADILRTHTYAILDVSKRYIWNVSEDWLACDMRARR